RDFEETGPRRDDRIATRDPCFDRAVRRRRSHALLALAILIGVAMLAADWRSRPRSGTRCKQQRMVAGRATLQVDCVFTIRETVPWRDNKSSIASRSTSTHFALPRARACG